jgi:hypothetical protein
MTTLGLFTMNEDIQGWIGMGLRNKNLNKTVGYKSHFEPWDF